MRATARAVCPKAPAPRELVAPGSGPPRGPRERLGPEYMGAITCEARGIVIKHRLYAGKARRGEPRLGARDESGARV